MLIFAYPIPGNPEYVKEVYPVGSYDRQVFVLQTGHGPLHEVLVKRPAKGDWQSEFDYDMHHPQLSVHVEEIRSEGVYGSQVVGDGSTILRSHEVSLSSSSPLYVLAGGVLYLYATAAYEANQAIPNSTYDETRWRHISSWFAENNGRPLFVRVTPAVLLPQESSAPMPKEVLTAVCSILEHMLGYVRADSLSELSSSLDALQKLQQKLAPEDAKS